MAVADEGIADHRLDVILPKWGLTMSDATIVRWLCREGEEVAQGDPLVEVETEKANAEVESPANGVVLHLVAEPGSVVPVGRTIAVLGVAGDVAASSTRPGDPSPAPASQVPPPERRTPVEGVHPSVRSGSGRSSPLARRVAAELGVDLASVVGTGPKGLVTEADVRRAAGAPRKEVAPGGESRVEPLTRMRKAIGRAMTRSLAEAPQLTLTREVDLAGARATAAEGVSLTDLLAAVVARTLPRHPRLNAHLVDDQLIVFDDVNLGLAVAVDGGLVTPVIMRAQALALSELARERRRLVELARGKRLQQTDLAGGTFTLTNLGAYGIDAFTPILNPPEVGILGVGTARPRPVVVGGGGLSVAETCVLSLTFDHRAADGAPAAEFLGDIAQALEDPVRLTELLE